MKRKSNHPIMFDDIPMKRQKSQRPELFNANFCLSVKLHIPNLFIVSKLIRRIS